MNDQDESFDKILNLEETLLWIMDQYGEELKRFIYTYVKNHSTTDDLFQEVMLIIYQKIDTFRRDSSLKTWVYRITANKCKDYLRSPAKRIILWKNQFSEKRHGYSPEKQVLQNEWKERLIDEIMNLSIKDREVLILRYYKEMGTNEIAALLEENASTIHSRIKRAKQKLKRQLGEVFIDEALQESRQS